MVPTIVGALLLTGCKGNDDLAQSVPPKTFLFEGKIDPKFVGTWKTPSGISTLDLAKDGSLKIVTVSESRNGKNTIKVSGNWLRHDSDLLFRYTVEGQGPVLLKYTAKLDGKTLTMQQAGMKVKAVYKRQ
jgi:hypothetical protein